MVALPPLPQSAAGLQRRLSLPVVPEAMVADRIACLCAPFGPETYGSGQHTLYLLPEACAELDSYVRFRRKRPSNLYEQQYIGMGHGFLTETGKILTVISRIIPIASVSRGATHASVISGGNDAALQILENERAIHNKLEARCNTDELGYAINPFLKDFGPSQMALFGHTHPGLGCFFSPVDRQTNPSTPSKAIVNLVVDPIAGDMLAMVGVDGEPMQVVACRPKCCAAPKEEVTAEELWKQITVLANRLLQKPGICGSLDYRYNRRGKSFLQLRIGKKRGGKC